jgi:DNA-binding transcriptional LysR family regulator
MANRTITAERVHKLRVFASIVELGSMTLAARSLGISRSGVSAHLKQLEADLEVRLIHRTTRTMKVSEIGEQVYERARRMLEAAQSALDVVDVHLGAVRGVLRVSFPVDLGHAAVVPVVETMRREHPELRIEALVGDRPVDIIRDGVDVALRVGFPEDSGLVMRVLTRTDEVLVASPDFVASHGLTQEPKQLIELPRVAHPIVDDPRPTLHHPNGDSLRLTLPPPVVSVGSSDLVRQFAIQGVGFAVLPECFVGADLENRRLVRVASPWYVRHLQVYALMPGRMTSPATQVFLDTLQEQVGRVGLGSS